MILNPFQRGFFSSITAAVIVLSATLGVHGLYPDTISLAQYWGQNSGLTQQPIETYCDDGVNDALIVSFISAFNLGGLPVLNLANACTDSFLPGTQLLHCPQVADGIKTCQSKGVKIILSLGGASGAYGFQNDDQAVTFANTLWDLFGNGDSNTRPFDDAVVDGFDLDIEGGGPTGYVALVNELRRLFDTDPSKSYYMTAAPQCPFPDAMLGSVISAAPFDAIHVQFYNNYCAPTSGNFNFETWDNWARTESPNKDVKIFLTIPGSPSAAGSGYVPFNTLKPIVEMVAATYSSYGGIAVWDASQSYGNTEVSPNYAVALGTLIDEDTPDTNEPNTTVPSSSSWRSSSSSALSPSASNSASRTPSASTNAPSPSISSPVLNLSDSCPMNGAPCSTEGELRCSGSSYGICNFGRFVLTQCPSSTRCFSTTDGNSVYCGFPVPGASDDCSSSSNQKMNKLSLTGPAPQAYLSNMTLTQFSVTNATKNSFNAIINARRMNNIPFGNDIDLTLQVHHNTKINHVEHGNFTQDGTQVRVRFKNAANASMAVIFGLQGNMGSDVFIAPDISGMSIV